MHAIVCMGGDGVTFPGECLPVPGSSFEGSEPPGRFDLQEGADIRYKFTVCMYT